MRLLQEVHRQLHTIPTPKEPIIFSQKEKEYLSLVLELHKAQYPDEIVCVNRLQKRIQKI